MKAKELAKLLLMTPDAQVMAWNPDYRGWYPITGLVGDQYTQEIQTDSDEPARFTCDEKLGDRCKKQCRVCAEWDKRKRNLSARPVRE